MVVGSSQPSMTEISKLYGAGHDQKNDSASPSHLARPTVSPLSPAVIHDSKHIAQAPLSSTSTKAPLCSPSAASTISTADSHASTAPVKKNGLSSSHPRSPRSGQRGSHVDYHKSARMSHGSRGRSAEEYGVGQPSVHHSPASDAHRTTVQYTEDDEPGTDLLQKNALRLTVTIGIKPSS